MKKHIFLIGTGQMAIDYTKVLKAQAENFTVIGRGETSALKFKELAGIEPITGGLNSYIEKNEIPQNSYFIIAVGTQDLMQTLLTVLKAGAHRVLIEKPAAISIEELLSNEKNLKPYFDKVFIAYNRRFYASVIEAQKLIEEDGGLQSMHFEFTEWSHRIEPLEKAPGVKENWFFANSTHVVDLAFYLAGMPVDWKAYSKAGNLKWHNKTNFTGAGITDKEVLFSYISNWESAGRWGIELLTNKRRIYLKPLEKVAIQEKGTISLEKHDFDDSLDLEFKPGLCKQIKAFIGRNKMSMINMKQHLNMSKNIYREIIK